MADVWANSMACHPRATHHIAGCNNKQLYSPTIGIIIPFAILKIVFRHNFFLMQFGLWWAAAFVSSPIRLFVMFYSYRVRVEATLLKEEFGNTVDCLRPCLDAVILTARGYFPCFDYSHFIQSSNPVGLYLFTKMNTVVCFILFIIYLRAFT